MERHQNRDKTEEEGSNFQQAGNRVRSKSLEQHTEIFKVFALLHQRSVQISEIEKPV